MIFSHWWLNKYKRNKLQYMDFEIRYFFEFQNVLGDSLPPANVIMAHCIRKLICDLPLTVYIFLFTICKKDYHEKSCFLMNFAQCTTPQCHISIGLIQQWFMYFWLILIIAQKMKFSNKDFFSKCDQFRRTLRIWSH